MEKLFCQLFINSDGKIFPTAFIKTSHRLRTTALDHAYDFCCCIKPDKTLFMFQLINNVVLGEPYGSIMTEYYDNNQRLDVYYGDNLAEEVTDMFFVCPNRALARLVHDIVVNQ